MRKFLSFMVALLATLTAFAGTKSVAEEATYTGIVVQTLSHPQAGVMGTTTSEQTVKVQTTSETAASITFSGFTTPVMPQTFPEFTVDATVSKDEAKGVTTYSATGFKVSVGMAPYNGTLEGEAKAGETPVFHLTLANATTDDVYFGANADAISAYKASKFATFTVDAADRVKLASEANRTGTVLAAGDNFVEPGQYQLITNDVTKYIIKEVKVGDTVIKETFGYYLIEAAAGDKVTVTTDEKAVPKTATITVDAADRVKVTEELTRASTTLTAGDNTVNAGNYYLNVTDATKYAIKEVKIGDNAVKENFGSYILELTGDEKVTVTTEEKAPATATITVDADGRVKATDDATRTETALVAGNNTVAAGTYFIVGTSSDYIIKEVKVGDNVVAATYGYYAVTIAANDTVTITTAAKPVLAEGDYLIANVAGGYLGGSNDWGTHATNINKPQWFTVTLSDGKYLLDSDQSNGGNSHYLASGLYVDAAAEAWEINYSDSTKTSFTLKINGQYLSAKDGLNKALALVDEADATCNWQFITLTDIKTSMNDAAEMNPVDVTALIKDPELKRNGNTSGYWTITGYNGEGTPSNFAQGQDKNIASCAESYHSNNGFKAVQTITLPKPGLYALSAQGFYRNDNAEGDDNLKPYIFAGEETSELPEKTGTENSMVEAYASFLQNVYPVEPVLFEATDYDQKIEIGVAGESTTKWNIFGEFSLLYFGAVPVDFDETPFGGTVTSLSEIVLSSDTTIVVNNNAKVTLLTMQSTVEEFSADALKAGLAEDGMSVKITLSTAVTAAGKYILNIPAGAFTIGGKANTAQTIEWTIEEAPAPAETVDYASVDPANNSVVESLSVIKVTFPEGSYVGTDGMTLATIKNAAGEEVTTIQAEYDWDVFELGYLKLANEITAPGTYTITVPSGVFALNDEGTILNTEFTLTYTIKEAAGPQPNEKGYFEVATDGETEQYLLNIEAKAFLIGANEWGTRASASIDKTYKVKIKANGDGTYTLNDYVGSSWNALDCQAADQIWVDGSGRGGWNQWVIAPVEGEDRVYEITNKNVAGKLGVKTDMSDSRLYMTSEEGYSTRWAFLSEETFNAYLEARAEEIAAEKKAQTDAANTASLAAMKAIMDGTNIYDQDGFAAYAEKYNGYKTQMEEGTLTEVVVNPSSTTGWHATTAFNFLLTPWTIGGEAANNFDKALYINTWSTEGVSDGSNFLVPFFEYWTGDENSLGQNTLSTTVEGLKAGVYDVKILARVRVKNGATEAPYGITMTAGNGEAVNISAGTQVGTSQMYLAEYTAQGAADADGKLVININIDADNNISWLSYKNVFYSFNSEATTGISTISTEVAKDGKFIENGNIVIVKNGKKFNVAGQAVK